MTRGNGNGVPANNYDLQVRPEGDEFVVLGFLPKKRDFLKKISGPLNALIKAGVPVLQIAAWIKREHGVEISPSWLAVQVTILKKSDQRNQTGKPTVIKTVAPSELGGPEPQTTPHNPSPSERTAAEARDSVIAETAVNRGATPLPGEKQPSGPFQQESEPLESVETSIASPGSPNAAVTEPLLSPKPPEPPGAVETNPAITAGTETLVDNDIPDTAAPDIPLNAAEKTDTEIERSDTEIERRVAAPDPPVATKPPAPQPPVKPWPQTGPFLTVPRKEGPPSIEKSRRRAELIWEEAQRQATVENDARTRQSMKESAEKAAQSRERALRFADKNEDDQ